MKEIKNYEGRYSATEEGRIFSHLTNKFLIPCDDGKGYLYVTLTDGKGHRQSKKIHRIIAETFLPNPNNLPCINHKDQNTKNNNLENLEWCDYEYNNCYGDRIQKIVEKNLNNATSKKVIGINIKTQEKIEFPSVREAARFLGDVKKSSNIQAVLAGRQKTAYGFQWVREN